MCTQHLTLSLPSGPLESPGAPPPEGEGLAPLGRQDSTAQGPACHLGSLDRDEGPERMRKLPYKCDNIRPTSVRAVAKAIFDVANQSRLIRPEIIR